jgi:hypothetical protein
MTVPIITSTDGPAITVAEMVGDPYLIPARVLELLDNQWLTDVVLRNAGANGSGMVSYEQSTPLFLGADVADVAEFAAIPVGAGQMGLPRIAFSTKKGLGVRVSLEMIRQNQVDKVRQQIIQLTNTMIRAEERAMRTLLLDPSIPTIAATAAWGGVGAKVRRDILNAAEAVSAAKPDVAVATDEDTLGFVPDTVIFPGSIKSLLFDDDEFLKVYNGDIAGENLAYTGRVPGDVLGLTPLTSRFFFTDRVLVLQRQVLGFRSDTWPLEVTPTYPEGGGGLGGPTQSFRSDASRKRALAVDQPKAACWITGVQ